MVAQSSPRQVVRLEINTETKEIKAEKLHEGFQATSVGASRDGSWAACSYKDNKIMLHLKEDSEDEEEKLKEWTPSEPPDPWRVDITHKKIYVIPFGKGPLYVYNRDNRKLKSDSWCAGCDMWDISATDDKMIVATCLSKDHFHIMNMKKDRLITIRGDGRVINVREDVSSSDTENEEEVVTDTGATASDKLKHGLAGVCITPGRHILVTDYLNKRLCVYSLQGAYLYDLDIDLGEDPVPWAVDVYNRRGEVLLAVSVNPKKAPARVRVYNLH